MFGDHGNTRAIRVIWVKTVGRVPTENTEDTESDSEFLTTDGTDEHGCSAITEIPALSP